MLVTHSAQNKIVNHNYYLMKTPNFLKILILVFVISAYNYTCVYGQKVTKQTTVILSLDGFRWDYPAKTATPALDRMARDGVHAVSLIPSFPSKTFPNHYTIATGLVPDHHGLVNNSFYDPTLAKAYSLGNKDARYDPVFYGGEPIWVTASRQGVRTASFYWVGTDVAVQGIHPDYWKMYDQQVPFIARIDTVIKWLSLPAEKRPRLVMAYYHEPDEAGHHFGPDDPRTLAVAHEMDSMVGIFLHKIKQLPDAAHINFIVVSDHGMGAISPERVVVLRDFIPASWPVHIEGGNPNFNIYADGAWADSVYKVLKPIHGIEVWKPAEVPACLDYGHNVRDGNIIVVADSSWSVMLTHPNKGIGGGTHGYDIRDTDIHAIFYAVGPAFKHNFTQPSFQNIHIYPLLAYLLGIVPAKTDGDLNQVKGMLR